MSRLTVLFLLAVGLLLGVGPMFAANFAVGTCKPSLTSYPTISAAVSGVPSGSTVEVCPGTYPEQVTIAQPLTLKGVTSGNAGQAVITVPGSGLTVVTTGMGYSIAPQVHVTAGPVNINDITVDGTGNNVSCCNWLAGILYDDGSSGTVNEVTVRNLAASGFGVGTWAENGTNSNESLTIENSNFHDIDDSGIIALGSNLFATAKGNTVEFGYYQVQFYSSGSLTTNVLNGGYLGVTVSGPVTVSGNIVNNQTNGIVAYGGVTAGVTATSNKISNTSAYGIYFVGSGNTFQANSITKAGIGIGFNCTIATVVHNTINDATTGLDRVPASFSGANSFDNVVTLRTSGCGSDAVHGPDLPKEHSGPVPAPAH